MRYWKKANYQSYGGCGDSSGTEGPKVFALGGAPTALSYLIELAEQGLVEADAVIGVPVGFINVEESKEELLQSGLPALVNLGRKGGSTIVVATINAIIYQLREVVTDDYVRYLYTIQ